MLSVMNMLLDGTVVSLLESQMDDCRYALLIAGAVVCRYATFDFAWVDFGRIVRCTTKSQAEEVASS